MKRWKVTTTHIPTLTYCAMRLGHWPLLKGIVPSPTTTERFYRWRWTAVLSAFTDNTFSAFNSPALFGLFSSTISRELELE